MDIPAAQGSASPEVGRGSCQSPWGDRQDRPRGRRPLAFLSRWLLYLGTLCLIASLLFLGRWSVGRVGTSATSGIRCVLPGEFQACDGLLLAPPEVSPQPLLDVLLEVIVEAHKYVRVYVLVHGEAHRREWADRLRQAGVPVGDVRFLQVPFADPWVRDYGPLVVKSFAGGHEMLDFDYTLGPYEPRRHVDDFVPSLVAAALHARAMKIPVPLDGGNILSNGAGLCITTPGRRDLNPSFAWGEVDENVREYLGGQQLVVLEPLVGEPTGHLDMFCTFTAADTVVIAECDPEADPENAEILNANARQLAEVRTNCGPLTVVRVPMPPRRGKDQWLTYTNVIYANGLLIVPSYPGLAADLEEQALATYRRLLPSWHVVSINALPLVEKNGSLHCVTMNLGGIDQDAYADAGEKSAATSVAPGK